MHRPACEANPQLSVGDAQSITRVADCVDAAIERRLGVEDFSPGACVSVEAHSLPSIVPLPVACVDHNQENVADIVPTFKGDYVIGQVGMCDLAGGKTQGRMVPTKIARVGDHALHRRAEIVADAQPVEAVVVAGTNPRIPEAIDMSLSPHEKHRCAGKCGVEGRGETALRAGVAVEPAEALGQTVATVLRVVVDPSAVSAWKFEMGWLNCRRLVCSINACRFR